MRAKYLLPALAAVTALMLTGCVDNSTPSTGGSSGGSTAGKVKVDDAAAALVPANVADTGKLVVGADPTYAPNEFKNEAGEPIGWGIEIASAVAAKLGLETEFQVAKFDNIIPSVTGGKADIGVSSFTDNVEREKKVDFVNYYTAGIQWASATGKDVDPDNACGLKVAVQATTYEDTDEVPAKSDACVAAGKAPIEKLKYDTQDAATNAVILGQADALSADSPVTLYAIEQTKGKLQKAGETFDVAPYGIVVAKDSKLAQAVQAALQSMVDDGTYSGILDKWGVADGAIDTITINAAANG
ncbi:ABC transporter substrate-binding protein [Cryobacterium sp. TMT1-21]|uniref:ABC transporter substrate-binding protein n=1 Tax=Cryobacterium shii TaxID=1259235 RepID=A0AAQ2HFH5_9MICO|nr:MULTISPECIES: ABC transporter substrate-binding protein [Cryobacterium]TFC46395.1 ABC transporter substrate-binding protein [Cryobacterium shii]TFC80733.1 ABC transporter substrate-binding protein [Cryobacterium sp. TmT2-59]TFD17317.1 ABC transporter substrate-binding protein [Cryobacterium sp. TMT1-21]TFD20337.1 ABC transporter substrate-binding protein [Cryobacterium sp. TMT2-23]TFD22358.1 ABC transporter substrate-binding protein [Cryobacterium sp. TMT4-10]